MATTHAPKEALYAWEGKDRQGKLQKGEMRAGSENIVNAALRRQGILATKIRKRKARGGR